MSNSLLSALISDLCRERGLDLDTVLGRLAGALHRAAPRDLPAIEWCFNETRGAFEPVDESVTVGGWDDVAIREALLEISAEVIPGRIRTSAPDVSAQPEAWSVVLAGKYAPAATGLTLAEYLELAERVRYEARRTGLPLVAVPGHWQAGWKRGRDEATAAVAVGWFVAAAENNWMPVGPYSSQDWGRTLEECDALEELVWKAIDPFADRFTRTNELLLVATGAYASAHVLTGRLEACPLGKTDPRWPDLYLREDFHADFRLTGLRARFGVRGRRLASAAAGTPGGVVPLGALPPESIFLCTRTFEDVDVEELARPRRTAATVEYGSLNQIRTARVAPQPHCAMKKVVEERPAAGLLGRLFSSVKRPSLLAELERTEYFLREYFPDLLAGLGLRPGATEEKRREFARAFELRQLPPDVDVLLAWHDGQQGSGSLFPEGYDHARWELTSIDDALDLLKWRKKLRNWSTSFLPLMDDGAGNMLVVDTQQGNRVFEWDHVDPENLRDVAPSLETMLREGLGTWIEAYEKAIWSTLTFDFEGMNLIQIAPQALIWSELMRLDVGAMLVAESAGRAQGWLVAGRDEDGKVFHVQAYAETVPLLWDALAKCLRQPLPFPREISDYEESLVSSTVSALAPKKPEDKLWFGYARSAPRSVGT
jgi:cell wall assembly regulator SMI1